MGAKFISKTKFKTSTQEIMKSQGKTVGYDASISAFGFSVGGGKTTTRDTTATNRFGKTFSDTTTFTIGTMLPAGENTKE